MWKREKVREREVRERAGCWEWYGRLRIRLFRGYLGEAYHMLRSRRKG